MLTLLAHQGRALAPHDLPAAWHLDPVLLVALALAAWAYGRGRRGRDDGRRAAFFALGLAAVAVALVSPLHALAGALASAHMVQHVLLILVAAPLLALSIPSAALLRGSPLAVRRAVARASRRVRVTPARARLLLTPVVAWLLHAAAVWFWHAAGPYGAALRSDALHAVEHATLFLTALLLWAVVVGARARASRGSRLLLVFGTAMQSVFLAALLTFAGSPWYDAYATTTAAWGLDPLADQQLAGAIMWVPGGLVYCAAALILLATWIREADGESAPYRL